MRASPPTLLLMLSPCPIGCRLVTCEDWDAALTGSTRCLAEAGESGLRAGVPVHEDQDQSVAARIQDNQGDSYFGLPMAALPDLDGDGSDELAVGAPLRDTDEGGLAVDGGVPNGGAWLFSGGPTWSSPGTRTVDEALSETADASARIGEGDARAGWSLASGRFLGDDSTALAVATLPNGETGEQSYTFILDEPSLAGSTRALDEARDLMITGGGPGRAIHVVANVGDTLNRGADMLALATQAPLLDYDAEGVVYLVPSPITDNLDLDDAIVWSLDAEDDAPGGFGARLLGADFDCDGRSDVVTGAPTATEDLSGWGSGGVYVISGDDVPESGPVLNALAIEWTSSGSDGLGQALAAGQLDSDGYPDLAVGAPGIDTVYIIQGDAIAGRMAEQAPFTLEDVVTVTSPRSSVEELGFSLAVPGDLDGDGQDELAMGAPRAEDDTGEVWLLYGPITANHRLKAGDTESPRLRPEAGVGWLGTALLAAGDLDGDGGPDLAVSDTPLTGLGKSTVTIWRMAGE